MYFVEAVRQLTQGAQSCAVCGEIGNLPLVWFAHIDNRHLLATVELLLKLECCTKLGRGFSEQVRVNASGIAQSTIVSPC